VGVSFPPTRPLTRCDQPITPGGPGRVGGGASSPPPAPGTGTTLSPVEGPPVSPKSLLLTAGVSLVVVIAYENYKGGKLPKIQTR